MVTRSTRYVPLPRDIDAPALLKIGGLAEEIHVHAARATVQTTDGRTIKKTGRRPLAQAYDELRQGDEPVSVEVTCQYEDVYVGVYWACPSKRGFRNRRKSYIRVVGEDEVNVAGVTTCLNERISKRHVNGVVEPVDRPWFRGLVTGGVKQIAIGVTITIIGAIVMYMLGLS